MNNKPSNPEDLKFAKAHRITTMKKQRCIQASYYVWGFVVGVAAATVLVKMDLLTDDTDKKD